MAATATTKPSTSTNGQKQNQLKTPATARQNPTDSDTDTKASQRQAPTALPMPMPEPLPLPLPHPVPRPDAEPFAAAAPRRIYNGVTSGSRGFYGRAGPGTKHFPLSLQNMKFAFESLRFLGFLRANNKKTLRNTLSQHKEAFASQAGPAKHMHVCACACEWEWKWKCEYECECLSKCVLVCAFSQHTQS